MQILNKTFCIKDFSILVFWYPREGLEPSPCGTGVTIGGFSTAVKGVSTPNPDVVQESTVYIHLSHIFSSHSSISGHIGYFRELAIVDKARTRSSPHGSAVPESN